MIHVDMDGVLCDFESQYKRLTGDDWGGCFLEREDAPAKWARIEAMDHFFADMPWCPGGQKLWIYLNAYHDNVVILSAISRTIPNCREDKYQWCKKNLGISDDRINLVLGKRNKQKFCKGPDDILIDDHAQNRAQWVAAGGIAPWKNNTLDTLDEMIVLGLI